MMGSGIVLAGLGGATMTWRVTGFRMIGALFGVTVDEGPVIRLETDRPEPLGGRLTSSGSLTGCDVLESEGIVDDCGVDMGSVNSFLF